MSIVKLHGMHHACVSNAVQGGPSRHASYLGYTLKQVFISAEHDAFLNYNTSKTARKSPIPESTGLINETQSAGFIACTQLNKTCRVKDKIVDGTTNPNDDIS